MILGRLLSALGIFPVGTDKSLNQYVIYIALPALVLQQVPKLTFSDQLLAPLLMPWLVIVVAALLVLLISHLLHWSKEITGALLLMVPLGNTGFLGLPMVEQFFGQAALPYAVVYDQLGTFLALSSYGTLILALYSSGTKPGLATLLKRLMSFPPFAALLVALLLRGVTVPAWMQNLLSMSASSMVPVVMVAIGVQTRLLLPRDELSPFALGLLLRLVIVPLLFILACRVFGLSSEAIKVSLFETATPPMVTASVLASVAGLKPQLSSALAAYGIVCAFFTLPVIYRLL
jgi:malate permease and related proteins